MAQSVAAVSAFVGLAPAARLHGSGASSLKSSDAPRGLVRGSGALSRAVSSRVTPAVCRAEQRDDTSESGIGRRNALLALGAVVPAITFAPLPFVGPEPALAADIIQRAQRAKFQTKLKVALASAVETNQDLIPALLRLAINDAVTYDKESKTGGANGSIRFPEELGRRENAGLEGALKLLETVKETVDDGALGGPLSFADLIAFGGSAALKRVFINFAVEKAGGDYQKGVELYRAIGSGGQWGTFDKKFGRADAEQADPEGRVPVWGEASTAELKAFFEPLGLKPRQITVLAIFLGDDLEAFEAKLEADPEFAPFVKKYQKSRKSVSQTDWQVDLIDVFTKVSTFGAPINTEAYSFKDPKPLKLRF